MFPKCTMQFRLQRLYSYSDRAVCERQRMWGPYTASDDVSPRTGERVGVSANEFTQSVLALSCRANGYEVGHEAVLDFCSAWAAAGDHLYVRLLDRNQPGGGRKAVRGVRQDASVQLSVRRPAGADVRGGG